MNGIVYTRHARTKFEILKQYGFEVTPAQVEETILNPERVIPQPEDRFIAQKTLSAKHVAAGRFPIPRGDARSDHFLSGSEGTLCGLVMIAKKTS